MKFSVLMPVYNGEKYIIEAVKSVKEQTYTDWELIIVNDGSTDRTLMFCLELQKNESRIKIINKENTGVSDSRNIAIKYAIGDYLVFLDSDDLLKENFLEEMLLQIRKKESQLVICNYSIIQGKCFKETKEINVPCSICGLKEITGLIEFSLKTREWNSKQYYGNLRTVWGKCFCRDIIEKYNIRFIHDLKYGEDMLFVLEYVMNIRKVDFLNKRLYCYRINSASAMHTRKWAGSFQGELYYKEAEKLVKKYCKMNSDFFETESALAVLWLETAQNDWECILEENTSIKMKYGYFRELIERPLYKRFCSPKAYAYSGKKQFIYMFLIRHKNVFILMLISYVRLKKQNHEMGKEKVKVSVRKH